MRPSNLALTSNLCFISKISNSCQRCSQFSNSMGVKLTKWSYFNEHSLNIMVHLIPAFDIRRYHGPFDTRRYITCNDLYEIKDQLVKHDHWSCEYDEKLFCCWVRRSILIWFVYALTEPFSDHFVCILIIFTSFLSGFGMFGLVLVDLM